MDRLLEFAQAHPWAAAVVAIVCVVAVVGLVRTLLQAAVAAAFVGVVYLAYLVVSDAPPPDLDRLQEDALEAAAPLYEEAAARVGAAAVSAATEALAHRAAEARP